MAPPLSGPPLDSIEGDAAAPAAAEGEADAASARRAPRRAGTPSPSPPREWPEQDPGDEGAGAAEEPAGELPAPEARARGGAAGGQDPLPESRTFGSTNTSSSPRYLVGVAVVVAALSAAVAFSGLLRHSGEAIPVRIFVQTSQASGYMLPEGETPQSLAQFLQRQARRLAFQLEGTPGGLDEMLLDRAQVAQAGRVDAFLFVWMASAEQCRDGDIAEDHRSYVREKLGLRVPVGFVCWWDGFSEADLTKQSLFVLDSDPRFTRTGALDS